MARDLKSFARKGKKGNARANSGVINNKKGKNIEIPKGKEGDVKRIEEQVKSLENKSESDLMQQLMQEVSQGKRDGTFSPEALDAFVKNVAPMMGDEEKKKLNQIVNQLK